MSLTATPGYRVVDAPATVPEPGLRNDVAAFVGPTARGPLGVPVRVVGLQAYAAAFGPDSGGSVARAVSAYIANGGEVAWVVRAGSGGAAAAKELRLVDPEAPPGEGPARAGLPGTTVRCTATSPGTWADNSEVILTYRAYGATGKPEFDVAVEVPGEPPLRRSGLAADELPAAVGGRRAGDADSVRSASSACGGPGQLGSGSADLVPQVAGRRRASARRGRRAEGDRGPGRGGGDRARLRSRPAGPARREGRGRSPRGARRVVRRRTGPAGGGVRPCRGRGRARRVASAPGRRGGRPGPAAGRRGVRPVAPRSRPDRPEPRPLPGDRPGRARLRCHRPPGPGARLGLEPGQRPRRATPSTSPRRFRRRCRHWPRRPESTWCAPGWAVGWSSGARAPSTSARAATSRTAGWCTASSARSGGCWSRWSSTPTTRCCASASPGRSAGC